MFKNNSSLNSNAQDKQKSLEGKQEELDNSNEGNFYVHPDEPINLNVPQGTSGTGI